MSDFSELKKLAEGAHGNGYTEEGAFAFRVGGPRLVLELIAEVERLRTAEGDAMTYKAGMENCAAQRDQLKAEIERLRAGGRVSKGELERLEEFKRQVRENRRGSF